jgi:hypothetical protein
MLFSKKAKPAELGTKNVWTGRIRKEKIHWSAELGTEIRFFLHFLFF